MKIKFFSLRDSVVILFIVIVPLLLFTLPKSKKTSLVLLGSYFLFVLFGIFVVVVFNISNTISNYFLINKEKKNETKNFDSALILGNNSLFSLKSWVLSSYNYDFNHFFKYLKLKGTRYKIFNKPTTKEFDEIIRDKRIKSMYLFGHGSRHNFALFEERPIYYCRYENKGINKDFIAQYHCNHGFGKSLADCIVKDKKKRDKCEITNTKIHSFLINREIRRKYREELKKKKGL